MIPIVYNLDQAKDLFLNPSTGFVLCVASNGKNYRVQTYLDAKAFFEANGETKRQPTPAA